MRGSSESQSDSHAIGDFAASRGRWIIAVAEIGRGACYLSCAVWLASRLGSPAAIGFASLAAIGWFVFALRSAWPHRSKRFRAIWRLVGAIALPVGFFIYLYFVILPASRQFSPERWKDPSNRARVTSDLIASKTLPGKSIGEVRALLGTPDRELETPPRDKWLVRPKGEDKAIWMSLYYDSHDKVIRVLLEEE